MKFRKGDQIIVTLGKDRDRKGKIEKVFPKTDTVVVPGVNIYKRHMKRRDDKNPGGIVEIPRPLKTSKIALLCKSCGKKTRIGYSMTKTGKDRICRKCKQKI